VTKYMANLIKPKVKKIRCADYLVRRCMYEENIGKYYWNKVVFKALEKFEPEIVDIA